MTSPPREIRVECPECGQNYQDWYRPSINLDLENFDKEYLDRASSAVCPRCGCKVYFDKFVVRDEMFYFDESARYTAAEDGDSAAAEERAGRRDHPVEVLFRNLQQVEPYPSGVIAVPARIPGIAFFPGGTGLWGAEAGHPLPEMPHGGVMVLGHDFHSEEGFRKSLAEGTEVPVRSGTGYKRPATWNSLLSLLGKAEISLTDCFFTNAYMGLRRGGQSTGRFPGADNPAFVRRCQDFLLLQLEAQRPSLVLTLGVWVPAFIAPLSPELAVWQGVQSFKEIDAAGPVVRDVRFSGLVMPSCTVVALTHPSLRGSNVRHREYGDDRNHEAEIAMLRDARKDGTP